MGSGAGGKGVGLEGSAMIVLETGYRTLPFVARNDCVNSICLVGFDFVLDCEP